METMTEADEAAFNDAFDETETPETAETGNAPEEAAEPEAGAETEAEQSESEAGGVPADGEAETAAEPENGETAVNDYSDLLDEGPAEKHYGYSWVLGKHWNIEATIGAGYLYLESDIYPCTHCGTKREKVKKHYVGPTQAALSAVYVF